MKKTTKPKSRRVRPEELEEESVPIKEQLAEDIKYKQYRRIVKEIARQVNIEKMDLELARLHSGRLSRNLYGKSPKPDSLINAALQDSANRSRMAEIRVEVTKQQSLLEAALNRVRQHMMNEYNGNLGGLKTKGERVGFVDQYLNSGVELNRRLEDFITRTDFIIKDIDQTGYSLKAAITCLEILYSKNNDRKTI